MRPRPLVIAAIAAAALVGAVGCGGSGDSGYIGSVNEVTGELQSDVGEITNGSRVDSPDQAADLFTQVSAKIDAAAVKLDEIDPPEEVAGLHDKLVQDLETLGDDAKGAADEIKAGGVAAAPGVLSQFVSEAQELNAGIESTIDEINAKLGQ